MTQLISHQPDPSDPRYRGLFRDVLDAAGRIAAAQKVDLDNAEDVAQDVIVALLEAAQNGELSLDDPAAVAGFTATVTDCRCKDQFRKSLTRERLAPTVRRVFEGVQARYETPEDVRATNELGDFLAAAVAELPTTLRTAFNLMEATGDVKAVAAQMEVAVSSVVTYLRRARERLSDVLAAANYPDLKDRERAALLRPPEPRRLPPPSHDASTTIQEQRP